jgi:hypothetical protein
MWKKLLIVTAASVALSCPLTGQELPDDVQVRQVLERYVNGWRDGDVQRLSGVLATDEGRVFWLAGAAGQDTLKSMTFAQALRNRRPQPDYGRNWSVAGLDIVDGRLAVARLHISRREGSYVDYLVLHRIAGQWRIVAKAFVLR